LLESAGEITGHLGYDKREPAGKNGGNSRNGTCSKTVLTDVGPVEIVVVRERDGSFEQQGDVPRACDDLADCEAIRTTCQQLTP
jgi:transposase-like protein